MALPIVAAEFWVGTEPELKFTPDGTAVCKFRGKAQDRHFNRETNKWEDGKELWANVTVWRKLAENTYESVRKGDSVVLTGKLSTRQFQTNGVNREAMELEASDVGASLRFRTTPHSDSAGAASRPASEPVAAGTGGRGPAPQNATEPDSEPPF